MRIKETIFIPKPKSVINGGSRAHGRWTRRAVLRGIYELRRRIMTEEGIDIFGVFEMTDGVEINIDGDFEGIKCDPEWLRSIKRRKMFESR